MFHEPANLLASTTAIVAANVAASAGMSPEAVAAFIASTYAALQQTANTLQPGQPAVDAKPLVPEAATTVRKSLASPDHIISMIDGKPYKTLRRHLATHGMTPAEYRERYGLKPDYPIVAPSYSEARRNMAKSIGLGRKPVAK